MPLWPDRYLLKKDYHRFPSESWDDDDTDPDAWPPATEHVKRSLPAFDPLAVAIRARLGLEKAVMVHITESTEYGGSSEVTQENGYEMVIEAGSYKVEFDEYHGTAENFLQMIEWLDGKEHHVTVQQ